MSLLTTALPSVLALASMAITATGCSEKKYHWTQIPYCDVADGTGPGNFKNPLSLVAKSSRQGFSHQLDGRRSLYNEWYSSTAVVAIVACDGKPSDNAGAAAGASPPKPDPLEGSVCTGQRIVVAPKQVTATAATRPGFDGALPLPAIPKHELECDRGRLAFGDGSP